MKKAITLSAGLFITMILLAQAPEKISYQAVIRNSSDQLVTDTQIGMQISILHGTTDGSPVYSETQTPTTNSNGLVSIEFGGQSGFSEINWANGPYYIKTETDITGGNSYTITGTSQLLSVPYALSAGALSLSKNGKSYDAYLKDEGSYLGLVHITVEQPFDSVPTVTDVDGNTYGTVKIGSQVWMSENLRTTKYNDNASIPLVTDKTTWTNLTSPAYCYINNTSNADTINTFGALYNWYTVETNKLCPAGWHLPTDEDWTELTDYIGLLAGGRLKESGTEHWNSPNTDAIGDSKFKALPGGYRYANGIFSISSIGLNGNWWSASEHSTYNVWYRFMNYSNSFVGRSNASKEYGFSVRCVRD